MSGQNNMRTIIKNLVVLFSRRSSSPEKTLSRTLTQDEEDNLVVWLRENSFLYDKSSADFKLKEKKNRTWALKEADMGLNSGDLSSIWYPNMRTQFSKLIKSSNKSGSGALERTARQQWLLDRFAFIKPFLVQLRTTRGSKVAFLCFNINRYDLKNRRTINYIDIMCELLMI